MSNLIECLRCKKILIFEECDGHVCTPILNGSKDIEIDYWWISRTEKGEPEIIAKGLDGILYTLKQTSENRR